MSGAGLGEGALGLVRRSGGAGREQQLASETVQLRLAKALSGALHDPERRVDRRQTRVDAPPAERCLREERMEV